MKKLLELKHWRLFLLLVAMPFIAQIIVTISIINSQNTLPVLIGIPIMLIVFTSLFFGWLYTMASGLHKKLPKSVPMNFIRFKVFLFSPWVYILFAAVFIASMAFSFSSGLITGPAIFIVIVPLHFFSIFGIFYCLYFNAKALKAVELKRQVTFDDFIGEFFLLWMFPIGIWILQPRINKIFDPNLENYDHKVFDQNL